MRSRQLLKKIVQRIKGEMSEKGFRKIASKYDMFGYKRIYFVHIRKAGGTSLNHMFLSLSGVDPVYLYSQLSKNLNHRIVSNGKIYVGWNIRNINRGNYFYGYSHTPLHKLDLPEGTFTISCFRDPVKRVISHYNMLMDYYVNKIDHPCMRIEGKWLGNDFSDFLQRIPRKHLLNQLYMFSSYYNIDEAVSRVKNLSHYLFTEKFKEGIDELNKKIGLSLEPLHLRKVNYFSHISGADISNLKGMLAEEYSFLNYIKQ